MRNPDPTLARSPDRALEDAIAQEERELFARIADDAGHVEQTLSLFRGRAGWVSGVVLASQAILFAGGIWSGWNFLQAQDVLSALHWGLPAAVLLLMSLMLKLALWPVMQANRVLVVLKRLEVMLAYRNGER